METPLSTRCQSKLISLEIEFTEFPIEFPIVFHSIRSVNLVLSHSISQPNQESRRGESRLFGLQHGVPEAYAAQVRGQGVLERAGRLFDAVYGYDLFVYGKQDSYKLTRLNSA